MRIILEIDQKDDLLTKNERFFFNKSFQLLAETHPELVLIDSKDLETSGFSRIIPQRLAKAISTRRSKADLIISSHPRGKFLIGNKGFILYCGQELDYWKYRKLLKLASCIITNSTGVRDKIIRECRIDPWNVQVVTAAPDEGIVRIDWQNGFTLKEKYSEGKDFFLYTQPITEKGNWEKLFRAFSIFKKWQQTDVRLVISGEIERSFKSQFYKRLAQYKYRADLSILELSNTEIKNLLPVAYGLIAAERDETGLDILNAFKAETPVIASRENITKDAFEGCVLPFTPEPDELSRQIINLYRDERLRDSLIEKGRDALNLFSWTQTVKSLKNVIDQHQN